VLELRYISASFFPGLTRLLSFELLLSKVDLDLGNYERFLDIKLTRDNNITTGKIYQVTGINSLCQKSIHDFELTC
jgi:hypothetical protein